MNNNEHTDTDDLTFAPAPDWAWMLMGAAPALAFVIMLLVIR